MKSPIHDFTDPNSYWHKIFEIQYRSQIKITEGKYQRIIYCWKNLDHADWKMASRTYCPIKEKDFILFMYRGQKVKGRITCVSCDYYDGDCPVLYVTISGSQAKKLEV